MATKTDPMLGERVKYELRDRVVFAGVCESVGATWTAIRLDDGALQEAPTRHVVFDYDA